ncbi:MAG: YciI family protein [Pseudomonadota bacterium]|nr:YciI family protein [Pseudomonadota bacterium]
MAFAIYTRDKPGHQPVRDAHRAAHYAYLQQHQHRLIASGGLQDDAGAEMLGGLIIIDVDTVEAVRKFVEEDPFTIAGLFEEVDIVRWKIAFFDGRRVTGWPIAGGEAEPAKSGI